MDISLLIVQDMANVRVLTSYMRHTQPGKWNKMRFNNLHMTDVFDNVYKEKMLKVIINKSKMVVSERSKIEEVDFE